MSTSLRCMTSERQREQCLCKSCLTHDVRVICIFSKTHFFGRFFSLFLIFKVKFMLVLTREFPLRKKSTQIHTKEYFSERERIDSKERINKQTKWTKKVKKSAFSDEMHFCDFPWNVLSCFDFCENFVTQIKRVSWNSFNAILFMNTVYGNSNGDVGRGIDSLRLYENTNHNGNTILMQKNFVCDYFLNSFASLNIFSSILIV